MADIIDPSFIVARVKEGIACLVIGGILSSAIYGVTLLQTYIYYRRYALSDKVPLKILVGILFILDTTTSALVAQSVYSYTVSKFGAPIESIAVIIPSIAAENGVSVVIAAMVQCYFAHMIWTFSKNTSLAVVILGFSVTALALEIAITVDLFTEARDIFSLGTLKSQILIGFGNGVSGICDMLIAGGLWYYLRSERSGKFSRTQSMVDRLMLYAIQRGMITTICQLMHMILTVAFPGRFFFIPTAFVQGKLYCNTLLATLNVRQSLRRVRDTDNTDLVIHVLTHRDCEVGDGNTIGLVDTGNHQSRTNTVTTLGESGVSLSSNDGHKSARPRTSPTTSMAKHELL